MHHHSIRALRAELHAWRAALSHTALYVILGFMLAGFMLAANLPLYYTFDVGLHEGYGGDLPHLEGFNTPEHDERGTYRWTADQARIFLPGLGQRPVTLRLDFFPVGAEAVAHGPREINLWIGDEQLAALPVRWEGARYSIRVPPSLLHNGQLDITIRTHTFIPANASDPRALGTPLDRVTVSAPFSLAPVAPDWGAVGMWLLATLLLWAVVLRALEAVPGARWWAVGCVGISAVLLVVAALLDPPRWSSGAQPALVAAAPGYLLALALRPALAWLARRLDVPLDARRLGWLVLLVVLAFGLRYGGRLYPASMHGDIGFHTNRFNEVVRGHIFILSRNRGIDFPYPPGTYVLLAPFTLLGIDPPTVLQLGAALVEGLGAVLVYAIVARTGKVTHDWRQHTRPPPLAAVMHTALLAAALSVFAAAGFMTTWWSFDTHIYTQFFTLLLMTTLTEFGLRGVAVPGSIVSSRGGWTRAIFVLCMLVFLGHFGFLINTVLLGALVLLVLWTAAWRGAPWARKLHTPLAVAGIGAGIVAMALFYSFFAPLLLEQARVASTGGLTELAQRAPVPRWYLWQVLWNAGLVTHFGFFPLLLAPVGVWLLARQGRPARLTAALIGGCFLVGLVFAVLPFLTLSTQSTRWLMFSAWGVAIGGAVAARWLWRCGYAGRLTVLAMSGFVLWNTFMIWLGPMLWRIRPPEPF